MGKEAYTFPSRDQGMAIFKALAAMKTGVFQPARLLTSSTHRLFCRQVRAYMLTATCITLGTGCSNAFLSIV
jgi:hypothetical protein